MLRSPAPQPKRELERSLEALNQLALSDSDTTKQSSVSDGSHKEALVYIFYLFIFFTWSSNLEVFLFLRPGLTWSFSSKAQQT